jgi:uncharacterized protein (UPF0276 family)
MNKHSKEATLMEEDTEIVGMEETVTEEIVMEEAVVMVETEEDTLMEDLLEGMRTEEAVTTEEAATIEEDMETEQAVMEVDITLEAISQSHRLYSLEI